MATLKAVSKETFQNKAWLVPEKYHFAAQDTVIGIGINEYAQAMAHIAIGFVQNSGGYALVAIQGFEQGKNLLVSSDGQWLGHYIPRFYRFYPFRLAKKSETEHILCINEDSGLVVEAGSLEGGQLFFTEDGPTSEIKTMFSNMLAYENEIERAGKVAELLVELELIEAWPLTLKKHDGETQVNGFFRISETRLNELSADELKKLRDAGGLALCYAQLFSMQKLNQLGELAVDSSVAENASNRVLTEKQKLDFFDNDAAISFDNL